MIKNIPSPARCTAAFRFAFASLLLCFPGFNVTGQQREVSVIPVPVSMQLQPGQFELTVNTAISLKGRHTEAATVAAYLISKLKPATGFNPKILTDGEAPIQLTIKDKTDPILGKEGYTLNASSSKVVIEANTGAGLFYGVQTFLQLLPGAIENSEIVNTAWRIPAVSITDYPRFGWRGIMLDVSRHFFPKDYIKSYIDRLARYKINRFHWHLTDDEGWRVQINSLPKLTAIGAWRVPRTGTFGENAPPKPGEAATYGGFYTQADIREVVAYARERHVEIIPEIDIPGHCMAVIASYPELSVTNDTSVRVNPGSKFATWGGQEKFVMHVDNTLDPTDDKVYQFLDKVFGELAGLFPFEYVHIGGDECYKGFWEKDPGVQKFMKKNNLKNGTELQAYFTKRVVKIVTSKKKKVIGWDEIIEGNLPPGPAVMAWRGVKGGVEASHQKRPVVMSPAIDWYLDMMQGDASLEAPVYGTSRLDQVYNFNILPQGIDSIFVLGGQGNVWTEQIPTTAQLEYMTYPRELAIAENVWSPKNKKDWKGFVSRVQQQFERLDFAGVNYSRAIYDPVILVKKENGEFIIELKTEIEGLDLYYTLDNSLPNHYHNRYTGKIKVPADADNFKVISYRNGVPEGHLISLSKEELDKRSGTR